MYVLLTLIASLMNFTLEIPVDPYIKKFLIKELGHEPVTITRHDYIGIVVYDKIQTLPPGTIPKCDSLSKIILQLTYHQSNQLKSAHISQDNISRINLYLKKLFKDKLFDYLNAKLELKALVQISIKKEILRFCDSYDITEGEYSFEALKKSYYRYRKSASSFSAVFSRGRIFSNDNVLLNNSII